MDDGRGVAGCPCRLLLHLKVRYASLLGRVSLEGSVAALMTASNGKVFSSNARETLERVPDPK
jgi:hypothetical protein